jgi:uncharacterized membrane protein YhaH (DUF805 family)
MASIKVILGLISLVIWILLFGAGLSMNSRPYRDRLSPPEITSATAVASAAAVPIAPISNSIDQVAFIMVIILFTPLNAALLTIVAGFIGGCASNITYSQVQSAPQQEDAKAAARTLFRTENPFASALRSFLVYLAFIAGVYITTNEPFQNTTPDQYVRFAGMISFLAFVVGYDPTKFQDLVNLMPRPGSKTS